MLKKLFKLDLRMFDEGASAGASTAVGQASGETSSAAGENNQGAKVIYGKVEPAVTEQSQAASEETTVTPDPEARKAEYAKFKAEYKEFYDKEVQDILGKRLKGTKEMEKQVKTAQTILDTLGPKYNADSIESLAKAIQEDASLFEEEAMRQGLTADQYLRQLKTERENAEYKRKEAVAAQEAEKQKFFGELSMKAAETKNLYPDFDLGSELENNEEFRGMVLGAKIHPTTAYQAVHFNDIVPSLAQTAAQKQQEATVNNIKARNSRPTENGISSSAGVIVKNDPSKLTNSDIDDLIKRVNRGEKISFS